MAQIHKMMYPTAWVSLGSSIQSCCEKRPLWELLPWSWLVFPQDQVWEHLEDAPPSLTPSCPSASLSTAVLRGRTASLLPLPHFFLESRAGPIHPCHGTGSGLKASLRCTSIPEEWPGVTVQKQGLSCRCPKTSGRAQARSGLHQSQTLYAFPLQGLQKCLLLQSGLEPAGTPSPSPLLWPLTELLPAPDRSTMTQHRAADVLS